MSSIISVADSDHTVTATAPATATAAVPEKNVGENDASAPAKSIAGKADGKLITDDGILVDWADDSDPENPRNWRTLYKLWVTFQLGMMAFTCSLASSITAPATGAIAEYVHVSREVAVLQISLYILGFATGPLLFGPISEVWGRRVSMIPPLACLGLFSIGTAVSRNAASVFLTRFFGGVVGSSAVSNVNAALGDIWSPSVRGVASSFYAVMVVGGPAIGPLIGAAVLVNPHAGWRWTEYIAAIMAFFWFTITAFAMPEVYSPVLLSRRAKKLRKETGDQRYFHPHEHATLNARLIITKHFSRPILMLTTEPVVAAVALYASFVYGMLYMSLEIFQIVFSQIRGMPPVQASLSFLSILVGVFFAVAVNQANQPRYKRLFKEAGNKPVPDARLPPIMVGGVFFTAGMFWFGWTAMPRFSVWNPLVAAVFIGFGFNIIFQQCMAVLVDTYGLYAASATAANTILRSLLAAAFPVAANPMFNSLGAGRAMSILGAVAAALMLVPFLLLRFGPALRRRSKMAMQQ